MTKAIQNSPLVQVPFKIRKQGGRKEIILLEGANLTRIRIANTTLKALARAVRWKSMLETGDFATVSDLAAHEKIEPSYMSRVMRMTLLAQDIDEGIVNGRIAPGFAEPLEPFSVEWMGQKVIFH